MPHVVRGTGRRKLCLVVLLHRPDIILLVDIKKYVRKDKWNKWRQGFPPKPPQWQPQSRFSSLRQITCTVTNPSLPSSILGKITCPWQHLQDFWCQGVCTGIPVPSRVWSDHALFLSLPYMPAMDFPEHFCPINKAWCHSCLSVTLVSAWKSEEERKEYFTISDF